METPDVDALLDRLALPAKVAQLGSVRVGDLLEDGAFAPERAAEVVPHGVGRVTRVGRESDLDPPALARAVRDLQAYLRREAPAGIPALVREESLCGYAGRRGTTVPQAIGMASTFDPDLVGAVAEAVAGQLRAVGCTVTLSPVADLGRDPRWGRIEETYGEDATLAARMATATVAGLQSGPDRVDATLKHFVGHGRPEGGRNCAPATASLSGMRDADCRPVRAAIDRADAASVMAAYHAVDGVPCHASRRLLTALLREEWDFAGTVLSDGRGVEQLVTEHGVAPDRRAAGVLALESGVDVEIPETACFGDRLVAAVRDGDVDESLVDRSVRRHLRQKARLGLLDGGDAGLAGESADGPAGEGNRVGVPAPAAPDPGAAMAAFEGERLRDLARRGARESQVLLTNDGILPLAEDVGTVAVVGPNADAPRNLLGNYAYGAAESMTGASRVVTPREGIRERVSADRVRYARGCGVRADGTGDGGDDIDDRTDESDIDAAVAAAREADVAVACVGGKSGIDVERESTGTAGEALDRSELGLPGRQSELVAAVADTGTPLVVVLVNGRPLAVPDVVDRADAVLEAWLPGQEGGHAVADVLFGTDPGGRLPVSIPRSVGQVPVHYSRTPVSAAGGYVFESGDPLFPFGHGESYAAFEYESLELDAGEVDAAGGTLTATVTVRNVAERAGEEVVQVYARDPQASVVRPVRELVGFRRLSLAAGEAATVAFAFAVGQFAFHDADDRLVAEPGRIELEAGRSSGDVRLSAGFDITGEREYPDAPAYFPDVTVR